MRSTRHTSGERLPLTAQRRLQVWVGGEEECGEPGMKAAGAKFEGCRGERQRPGAGRGAACVPSGKRQSRATFLCPAFTTCALCVQQCSHVPPPFAPGLPYAGFVDFVRSVGQRLDATAVLSITPKSLVAFPKVRWVEGRAMHG